MLGPAASCELSYMVLRLVARAVVDRDGAGSWYEIDRVCVLEGSGTPRWWGRVAVPLGVSGPSVIVV